MLQERSCTKNSAYNGGPVVVESEPLGMDSTAGNTAGSLLKTQHDVLVGSLLGDGSLRCQGNRKNALYEVNHCYRYKEYVDWKSSIFKVFVSTPPARRLGNGSRVAYRFTTRSLPVFTEYFRCFYRNRKKIIPLNLVLTPLSLAVWFMDDGCKSRSSCYLNTQQFGRADQERLQLMLFDTFNLNSSLNKDKDYYRIRISTESTQLLKLVIEDYILRCFRYKLDDDPVTTDPKGEVLARC